MEGRRYRVVLLVFSAILPLAIAMNAQDRPAFVAKTFEMSVLDTKQNASVRGKLTLAEDSVGFESSDIVFSLPVREIQAVEYQGTRKAFMTLVLDSTSKFISSYPSLVTQRTDAYQQPEFLLALSLGPKEMLEPATKTAKAFQSLIVEQQQKAAKAIIGIVQIDRRDRGAHPFLGTTIRVVLNRFDYPNTGRPNGVTRGYLTFFIDSLQFNSRDLNFNLPLNTIQQVDCAGARDTFLRVAIDPQDNFNHQYEKYLAVENFQRVPRVLFMLDVAEALAPAYKTAQDFQKYFTDTTASRTSAIAANDSAQDTSGGINSPAQNGEKHELGRVDAGFLEKHNPKSVLNGFKLINGLQGDLIVFDAGIGYVSKNTQPNVKPVRKQFLVDGYLKFFIPKEAITAERDVSVIRNRNNIADSTNSFIVEFDLDKNSDFFRDHAGLMTESDQDNKLFFAFHDKVTFDQFVSLSPTASSRDQF